MDFSAVTMPGSGKAGANSIRVRKSPLKPHPSLGGIAIRLSVSPAAELLSMQTIRPEKSAQMTQLSGLSRLARARRRTHCDTKSISLFLSVLTDRVCWTTKDHVRKPASASPFYTNRCHRSLKTACKLFRMTTVVWAVAWRVRMLPGSLSDREPERTICAVRSSGDESR